MPQHLVIGEGRLKISLVHSDGKVGLLITPLHEPHPVGSEFETEPDGLADIRDGSIIIWGAGIDGARVLQDAVNSLVLHLDGYVTLKRPEAVYDPRDWTLTRTVRG